MLYEVSETRLISDKSLDFLKAKEIGETGSLAQRFYKKSSATRSRSRAKGK